MKRLLFCLALAATPGISGDRQAPATPTAPIALFAMWEEEPSVTVRETLESELIAIMNPVGLHFAWRTRAEAESGMATELVVLTFKGRCSAQALQPMVVMPTALGWTHVSEGVVLPFSDLDCGALRGFLQRELLSHPTAIREELFGRALARVLAHELYHVLAGTVIHGACGIGKSGFTINDLMADEFLFDASELRTLLQSKAHQSLERAAATPTPLP